MFDTEGDKIQNMDRMLHRVLVKNFLLLNYLKSDFTKLLHN